MVIAPSLTSGTGPALGYEHGGVVRCRIRRRRAAGGWFRTAAGGWFRTATEAARPGWADEGTGAG
ncbi:hypothetical protein GCM10017744_099770 [Streptomyces antimycoticus]|uniref:Uncharacterized protein n=1 Tax=Streptomyces antimycoticus TaxID=68175 RepID=A0A4D4JUC9_9ACTN|nr:hypothetical protein SANT12839_012170 [Streptomyces antimycoticus]